MKPDDEDELGMIPDPDAEPTPSERAHAKTFADLVDKTLAGRTPPAVSAEDRALLEVATVIRATSGGLPLAESKQRSIVEAALRQAIGEPSASRDNVIPIASARRRWLPWGIAGASSLVAAAAIAMLWLRAPRRVETVPTAWRSRPSDALIGPIDRKQVRDASARLDYIFADRLDGYRERRFARGAKP
jgi:hypothetical protein